MKTIKTLLFSALLAGVVIPTAFATSEQPVMKIETITQRLKDLENQLNEKREKSFQLQVQFFNNEFGTGKLEKELESLSNDIKAIQEENAKLTDMLKQMTQKANEKIGSADPKTKSEIQARTAQLSTSLKDSQKLNVATTQLKESTNETIASLNQLQKPQAIERQKKAPCQQI